MASSGEERCLYEVMGLPTTCSADEIRSAYRRLALQRHPDKLVQSGLTQAEATASFQELLNAYDVLSDPKERSFYDSRRSRVVFSNPLSTPAHHLPDLFPFFSTSAFSGFSDSGKGFYKIYSAVFDRIYSSEVNFARIMGLLPSSVKEAPILGNLDSPYPQAKSFFDYWAGFVTVLDFSWSDLYDSNSGPTRKSRRVMEEENKKVRKRARREYNETVRGLAEFVKKRDKRVIEMLVKKEAETAKRREDEKNRLRAEEKEKADRARTYQEPAWSRIDEEELQDIVFDGEDGKGRGEVHELYCILCGKKFKSEKQWKNHEQSRKHKEKVVQMKHFDKEGVFDDCGVNKLSERMGEMAGIEEKEGAGASSSDDDDEQLSFRSSNEAFLSLDDSDDENSVLEYMVSANLTAAGAASSAMNDDAEVRRGDAGDDEDAIECDGVKNTGLEEDGRERPMEEIKSSNHTIDDSHIENSDSCYFPGNDARNKNEQQCRGDDMSRVNKKGATARRATKTTKNSAKTTKQKQQSSSFPKRGGRSNSSNTCETCGHDFESRNQLHKHLGDTGHASFKHRL